MQPAAFTSIMAAIYRPAVVNIGVRHRGGSNERFTWTVTFFLGRISEFDCFGLGFRSWLVDTYRHIFHG